MNRPVGKINKKVIKIRGLDYEREKTIFIGDSNICHMKSEHPNDFEKYGNRIKDIIENPTYLARNKKKKLFVISVGIKRTNHRGTEGAEILRTRML